MGLLNKEQLWAVINDFPAELVTLEDSNGNPVGEIKMRGLSAADLTKYQQSLLITLSSGQQKPNTRHLMTRLIVMCAINDDGSPYFEESDILNLENAPARMIMPLFESAQRLCGLTEDDFKDMVGDFNGTQNGHSTSV